MEGVLFSKDLLPLILMKLKGPDRSAARITCKTWYTSISDCEDQTRKLHHYSSPKYQMDESQFSIEWISIDTGAFVPKIEWLVIERPVASGRVVGYLNRHLRYIIERRTGIYSAKMPKAMPKLLGRCLKRTREHYSEFFYANGKKCDLLLRNWKHEHPIRCICHIRVFRFTDEDLYDFIRLHLRDVTSSYLPLK